MFGSSKSSASLSSGLLARKGQARPAMRPQGYHGTSLNLEDLGWDDMGDEAPAPAPAPRPVLAAVEAPPAEPVPAPPVLAQREVLREEVEAAQPAPPPQPEVKPVSVATAGRIAREVRATKAKSAAFTLRLDAERHLRLRLASACRHRSAQAIVTEALDAFLSSCAEVEPLIQQLGRSSKTSGEKS